MRVCIQILGASFLFFSVQSFGFDFPAILTESVKKKISIHDSAEVRALLKKPGHSLLVLDRVEAPELSTTKYQHRFRGLEVVGSRVYAHEGIASDMIVADLARFDVDTQPSLSVQDAASLAQAIAGNEPLAALPELKILPSDEKDGNVALAYFVKTLGSDFVPGHELFIDAHSGNLISDASDWKSFAPVWVVAAERSTYQLFPEYKDPSGMMKRRLGAKKPGIVDYYHLPSGLTDHNNLKACQLKDLSTNQVKPLSVAECAAISEGHDPGLQDFSLKEVCEINDENGMPFWVNPKLCELTVQSNRMVKKDPDSENALRNSNQVLAYYASQFNRNSFDDNGSRVLSVVHAGVQMGNAFWKTSQNIMVYGEGDDDLKDLTLSVDVAGHEMTHGVIAHSKALGAIRDAGALNEAYADFFGKMIEGKGDWVMGANLFKNPAHRGIRDLANPSNIVDEIPDSSGKPHSMPYPDHIRKQLKVAKGACTGANDLCWVHYNSTIASHAMYLVHQNVGAAMAQQIFYHTLRQELGPSSTFQFAAQAAMNVCKASIRDSRVCDGVKKAYDQVGIQVE